MNQGRKEKIGAYKNYFVLTICDLINPHTVKTFEERKDAMATKTASLAIPEVWVNGQQVKTVVVFDHATGEYLLEDGQTTRWLGWARSFFGDDAEIEAKAFAQNLGYIVIE